MPLGIVIGNVGFEAMLSLVAVLWIARTLIVKENPLPRLLKDPFVLPWLFLYAAVLLSLTVNGPGNKGVALDIVFVRHLLFLMALMDISKRVAIERYFLIGMAASVLLAACNLLLAHGIGYDLMGKPAERYTSKLKEAARIAGLFSYLSPMLVAWAFSLPFWRLVPRIVRLPDGFYRGFASAVNPKARGRSCSGEAPFGGRCAPLVFGHIFNTGQTRPDPGRDYNRGRGRNRSRNRRDKRWDLDTRNWSARFRDGVRRHPGCPASLWSAFARRERDP